MGSTSRNVMGKLSKPNGQRTREAPIYLDDSWHYKQF